MQLANGTIIPEHAEQVTDNFVVVTPSDTTVLTGVRWIFVGGAGNLAVQNGSGATMTFTGVTAGTRLPISPSKVMATNTTATLIIAGK